MIIFNRTLLPALAIASTVCATSISAQTKPSYPSQAVTIFAASPGGNPDFAARLLAQKLSERLGKPFIVENKPGAGGTILTAQVAKASPNGHILGLLTTTEMSVNPHLFRNLSVKAMEDLVPVAVVATVPTVLAVSPNVPAKTLAELIAYAKANPGKLNYGSSGSGSIHHLTAMMFAKAAGIDITHVPYKGSSQTVPALITGDVQLSFVGIPQVKSFAENGRIRLLGISSANRSKILPTVPTLAEQGLSDFNVVARLGLFAPRGTSVEIRSLLGTEIATVLADPDVQKRLLGAGMELELMDVERFKQVLAEDFQRYGQAVRDANVTLD